MSELQSWHTKNEKTILGELGTSRAGLANEEVKARHQKYGPNKLPDARTKSIFSIFVEQFKNPLIYMLMAAGGVLLASQEWIDSGIIAFVLMFNAVAGTVQAGRAQNTLQALRKFIRTDATAIRNGKEVVVSDSELVPGDIISLQEGEKVPADARLIETKNFRVDESALTGESDSVNKNPDILQKADLAPAERKNMIFRGTHVVGGSALAVVVATGMNTEVGRISQKISSIDTEIPLQANVRHLSNLIMVIVIVISVSIFTLGLLSGREISEMFKLAVAVVVSAVPEGLPVVMTLLLATGVWRMSKQKVLVKRLSAVEALGETKIIAVDKTGTVTENKMVVEKVFVDDTTFEVSGAGYEENGRLTLPDKNDEINPEDYPAIIRAASISTLCSDAVIKREGKKWKVAGEPTQAAMRVFAAKLGVRKEALFEKEPELAELPFEPRLKYHVVLQKTKSGNKVSVAGAPELILHNSTEIFSGGKVVPMSEKDKKRLGDVFEQMAAQGLRVIALSEKESNEEKITEHTVKNLRFIGFLGMKDALRENVESAVKAAKSAGARVVMITGDHKATAQAVAREAGIMTDGDKVLLGEEIDKYSDKELARHLDGVSVFARVTPEHKLRLVQAYRHRGEIVAMTGDGVNDALSLVAADLGVAMGGIGTEVAKEASDLVLMNDDFGNIVSAMEEGRSIFKNLKKVVVYLFSTSIGEILVILGALILGYPLPVLAGQLIWLNFVTDGFLVANLAMEPKEKGILSETYKKPSRFIIDSYMAQRMALMSVTMAVGTLWLFQRYFEEDLVKGMTVALTTMAVYQWMKAWNCRSDSKSVFAMNPLGNKYLLVATFVIILLQLAALHIGFLQNILRTVPLSLSDWGLIVAVSLSTVIVDEIRKFIRRNFELKKGKTGQLAVA